MITGHEIFGRSSPEWDLLGLHPMDTSDPASPKVVHGLVRRDAESLRIVETGDSLGMRATASHDTILDTCSCPTIR